MSLAGKENKMLKAGSATGSECPKCLWWDDDDGCAVINDVTIQRDGEDIYCVDGIERGDEE